MSDIRSFIIINRKTRFVITLFSFVSVLIIFILLLFLNLKYQKYIRIDGQVIKNDDKYKLLVYLNPEQLNTIKENNELFINGIKYSYDIDSISDEYFISNDYKIYLNVVLNVDLKNSDKIINNLLKIKVLESNERLFYYLKKYLKKENRNEKS